MERITYLDFDLKISASGDQYIASVLRSPGGEGQVSFALPFSPIELENLILRMTRMRSARRRESPELEAARSLGEGLFQAVFQGVVGRCLSKSQEKITEQTGLRIKLRLQEAPGLSELPWEYLFDQEEGRFLAQSVYTPVVRYLEFGGSISPLKVRLPVHILGVIANPTDYKPPLNVKDEQQRLEAALDDLIQSKQVKITWLAQATLDGLRRTLRADKYHVFHFIGHGGFDQRSERGVLVFTDKDGHSQDVDAERLGVILHDHRSLRLAVLNACEGARSTAEDPFSGVATNLVRQKIPAVVAMQFEISDPSARAFTGEFYTALAQGYPVDAALAEARKAVYCLPEDVEWGTPVLYLRAEDGILFDVIPPPEKPEATSQPKSLETAEVTEQKTPAKKPRKTAPWAPEPKDWSDEAEVETYFNGLSASQGQPETSKDVEQVSPSDLYTFQYLSKSRVWISKYLVTNAQYQRFLEADDYAEERFWMDFPKFADPQAFTPQGDWGEEGWRWLRANFKGTAPENMRIEPRFWRNPKFGIQRPALPVVGITWYEAYAYCQWLQAHWIECEEARQNPSLPSFSLRLPLESEMEELSESSLAEVGYSLEGPGGEEIDIASLLSRQKTAQSMLGSVLTHGDELGEISLRGRLEQAGIRWEWLANLYKANQSDRVMRIAGWANGQVHIKVNSRYANPPVHFAENLGFRVVYYPTLVDEATIQESLRAERLTAIGAIVEPAEAALLQEPKAKTRAQPAAAAEPEKDVPADLYTFVHLPGCKGWIGKYPVTNIQYQRFLEAADFASQDYWMGFPRYGSPPKYALLGNWGDEGWKWLQGALKDKYYCPEGTRLEPRMWREADFGIRRPSVPVVAVNWYEANAYCKWLQAHWADQPEGNENQDLTPRQIRLPTEKEWIVAAGGAKPPRRLPWDGKGQVTEGKDEIIRRANVRESEIGCPTPVDKYPQGQSQLGVWDLAGNVEEWQANYSDKNEDYMMVRGGWFFSDIEGVRLYCWGKHRPSFDQGYLGFRVFVSPR